MAGRGAPNAAQSATLKAVRRLQDATLSPSALYAVLMVDGGLRFEVFGGDGEMVDTIGVGEDGRLWIEGSTCEARPPRRDGIPDTALVAGCGLNAGHPPPHVIEWPEQRAVDGSGQEAGTFSWVEPGVEVRVDPRLPRDAWFVVVPVADDERRDPAGGSHEEKWRVAAGPEYVEDEEISRVAREFGETVAEALAAGDEEHEWPVQRPQRQDSLAAQLRDVVIAATRMGCYDAADFIGRGLAG